MGQILPKTGTEQPAFMAGGGEMGALTRAKDWSKTSLGTPAKWPKSLQTALAIVLHSKFPMFIFWGPNQVCFYNDAYRPSLGKEGKHPAILGQAGKEAWEEIWPVIYPLIQQVLDGGDATWSEDQLIPIYRNGTLEDVYWTFSYSRITNDEGEPGGILVTCVETTEKVLNQKKLEETADLLQFSTDAAELGTWDYNPQTQKFTGNARFKSWFGLDAYEEVDLQVGLNVIAAKDRERVVNAMTAALDSSTRALLDIEYTVVHPQTKFEIVVQARGKSYFDENGVAYRFSGTMEDITEENTIKKLREESEQNLRNLVEQAPVAMCVLKGKDHIVEIANEKMISLWGKVRDEVMHRPVFEGLPEAKEQGLESLLEHVYHTGERFTAQERPVNLPREHGMETVYQNFVYEPLLGDKGSIDGVIAVTIDVTEQVIARRKVEEAEERARLAIEAGNLGTFDLNLQTDEITTSGRFARIMDTSPACTHEELVKSIYPEDMEVREKAFREAISTGELSYEIRIIRKDGTMNWVRFHGRVIYDKEGTPQRLIGTAADVSTHKAAEQQREEYIAIASHELRNPLTSLRLSLDLLLANETNEENLWLGDKARTQLQRIMTMTNEFLNVSKIASGIFYLNKEVFNLKECIEESITTFQAGMIKNLVTVSGTPDINVFGDKFRIEQVLINLLSNASKYSPQGANIKIEVSYDSLAVKIKVTDKGIGIAAEKLPHIFKKFSRIEGNQASGYGLGLYISQQIVRKHGGEMGVESEIGKGSTFWFTIPL